MLRKPAAAIAVLLFAAIAYLVLIPAPVEPVAWQAPQAPGYTGPHARNARPAHLRHLVIGNEHGPESVAFGANSMVEPISI